MPMYDDGYSQVINNVTEASFTGTQVWIIISCILAIIGGLFLYFAFINKKESEQKEGFIIKVHEFLNFKLTIFESILKILYIISVLAITLSSFAFITSNFFTFIYILVFGNLSLRIVFEVLLKLFILCKDVAEINKKTSSTKDVQKKAKTKKDE